MGLEHTPEYGDGSVHFPFSVPKYGNGKGTETESSGVGVRVRVRAGRKIGSTGTEFRREIDGKYINALNYSSIFKVHKSA